MTTPERGLKELRRSLDRWQKCDADAMSKQSTAAVAYALDDAKHDIALIAKERDQLRARCGELGGLLKTKNSALKTFGRHYESCRSTYQLNGVWGACSCGFDAAYDSTLHLTKEQTTK